MPRSGTVLAAIAGLALSFAATSSQAAPAIAQQSAPAVPAISAPPVPPPPISAPPVPLAPAGRPVPPPPPPGGAAEVADIDTPRAEAMVDVGGRRLHCVRYGAGAPTVVLISGLGAPQRYWNPIVPSLAAVATVVTYDRPGIGASELGDAPNHGVQAADDLARLLAALAVPRPFVLVGHSYGGRIARLYASRHPEGVGALLLEESSHEDSLPAQIATLDGADRQLIETYAASFLQRPTAPRSERDYRHDTIDQLHAAGPLPRVPLVVMVAADGSGLPQELSPAGRERLRQINVDMQRRLAALVPGGRTIELMGVGHTIHVEKPGLVLEPLLALVAEVHGAAR
jgi:pimeloyl-ACP methyl ester carboxylesterase